MTVTIIPPCKGSSAMVMARNLKRVDPEVGLAFLIFFLLLEELFSSPMARYGIYYLPDTHYIVGLCEYCLMYILSFFFFIIFFKKSVHTCDCRGQDRMHALFI